MDILPFFSINVDYLLSHQCLFPQMCLLMPNSLCITLQRLDIKHILNIFEFGPLSVF
jgi:hypothetical protein